MLEAGLRYRHEQVAESQVGANDLMETLVPSGLADVLLPCSCHVDGSGHPQMQVHHLRLQGLQLEQLLCRKVELEAVALLQLFLCVLHGGQYVRQQLHLWLCACLELGGGDKSWQLLLVVVGHRC